MPLKLHIILTQDTHYQMTTEGGQIIQAKLPRGYKLTIPAEHHYGQIPFPLVASENQIGIAKLPADWFEDSSLERWFPLTAETLIRLKRERDELLNTLKVVLPFVEDEHATRENSFLPEPTQSEEGYLAAASSAVEAIKSAIAMVEG